APAQAPVQAGLAQAPPPQWPDAPRAVRAAARHAGHVRARCPGPRGHGPAAPPPCAPPRRSRRRPRAAARAGRVAREAVPPRRQRLRTEAEEVEEVEEAEVRAARTTPRQRRAAVAFAARS